MNNPNSLPTANSPEKKEPVKPFDIYIDEHPEAYGVPLLFYPHDYEYSAPRSESDHTMKK